MRLRVEVRVVFLAMAKYMVFIVVLVTALRAIDSRQLLKAFVVSMESGRVVGQPRLSARVGGVRITSVLAESAVEGLGFLRFLFSAAQHAST